MGGGGDRKEGRAGPRPRAGEAPGCWKSGAAGAGEGGVTARMRGGLGKGVEAPHRNPWAKVRMLGCVLHAVGSGWKLRNRTCLDQLPSSRTVMMLP